MVDLNSRIHHNGKPPYKHTNLNTQNTVFDSFKTYIGLNQLGFHSKTIKYFLSFGCIYVDCFDVGGGSCWRQLMLVTTLICRWLRLQMTSSVTNFSQTNSVLKKSSSWFWRDFSGHTFPIPCPCPSPCSKLRKISTTYPSPCPKRKCCTKSCPCPIILDSDCLVYRL